MKKLFAAIFGLALVAPAFAAGTEATTVSNGQRYREGLADTWPCVVAVSEWPAAPEVTGLRLTIPFSTKQETVTGFDLGLWGRCRDFEGLAVSVLRNDVKDTLAGVQLGLYNSANRADLFCAQVGLFNETQSFRGFQCGLVNKSGDGSGFQLGIINVTESFYGYQLGIINVIRDSEVPFLPIANIGF